ncbi:MAG: hypothetical protein AB7O62_21845 [Pirellulales bacterium]
MLQRFLQTVAVMAVVAAAVVLAQPRAALAQHGGHGHGRGGYAYRGHGYGGHHHHHGGHVHYYAPAPRYCAPPPRAYYRPGISLNFGYSAGPGFYSFGYRGW